MSVVLLLGLNSGSLAQAAVSHSPVKFAKSHASKRAPAKAAVAKSTPVVVDPTAQWPSLARQVGLNEKSHGSAVAKLRQMKNLDLTLLKALETSQRPLALDVIVALKMESLIPDLLERATTDEDGFLVLALNSFLSATNQERILKAYVEDLSSDRERLQSAASIVAMLDPMGRAERAISKATLAKLLVHEYPEVRSSALYYARLMMAGGRHREYLEPAMKTLTSTPYQLRIQALFLIDELQSRAETRSWVDVSEVTRACDKELNMSVKPWCAKILTSHKVVAK